MNHFQSTGGLRRISPIGLAGGSPVSTSSSRSESSPPSTPPIPPTAENPDNGVSPSPGSLTIASADTLPGLQKQVIIPLSATEQAWCREYSSLVVSQEASSLVYEPGSYEQLQQLHARFQSQPTVSDVTLGKMIDELAEYLNCAVPTARALSHYYKEMGTWPEALVDLAFTRARINWSYKKFPLIADFTRWVDDDKKARDELATQVKISLSKLTLPRIKEKADQKRAAEAAKKTAEHNARMVAMPKAERDDMIRRYAGPERAADLIAHYDAMVAALD